MQYSPNSFWSDTGAPITLLTTVKASVKTTNTDFIFIWLSFFRQQQKKNVYCFFRLVCNKPKTKQTEFMLCDPPRYVLDTKTAADWTSLCPANSVTVNLFICTARFYRASFSLTDLFNPLGYGNMEQSYT